MQFTRLDVHSVRNLQKLSLLPHPKFNVLLGKNGSGKTSLLEAIYLLGVGRSFRAHQIDRVIAHEAASLACFAQVRSNVDQIISLGIEKNRQGLVTCKMNGLPVERLSEFAKNIPLQLITPESFRLLLSGPEERRKFLDWGVFHVEPFFAQLCMRYSRLLKQRNAALKYAGHSSGFDKELIEIGNQITLYRKAYLARLLPFFESARQKLLPQMQLQTHYQQGWPSEISLAEAFQANSLQDKKRGMTHAGPHRAELALSVGAVPVQHVLSRGQQKLLLSALFLAQGQQLQAEQDKRCVYLIDDLASELDEENRTRLLRLIAQDNHQAFFTGVEIDGWQAVCKDFSGAMFHVEHGQVQAQAQVCDYA